MPVASLNPECIIPPDLNKDGSKGVVFLFCRDHQSYDGFVNHITRHIQKMDPEVLKYIERSLDLQLTAADWDKHGNVCFANDPDLRPEFRTTFHAIDLWDYYYTLWHSATYWNSTFGQQQKLHPPLADHFWKIVEFGSKLRLTHALKIHFKNTGITFSDTGHRVAEPMSNRFQIIDKQTKSGILYLNNHFYIDHVPLRTWEYHIAGENPLHNWILQHINQEITEQQLTRFIKFILAIDQTQRLQNNIDTFLSKTRPSIDWLSL